MYLSRLGGNRNEKGGKWEKKRIYLYLCIASLGLYLPWSYIAFLPLIFYDSFYLWLFSWTEIACWCFHSSFSLILSRERSHTKKNARVLCPFFYAGMRLCLSFPLWGGPGRLVSTLKYSNFIQRNANMIESRVWMFVDNGPFIHGLELARIASGGNVSERDRFFFV